MKTTVTLSDFHKAFKNMNRDENFSYNGQTALFNYLEHYEESTGEDVELDIIALCCEYNEYENWTEFISQYPGIYKDTEELADYTTVIIIEGTNSFIVQGF